MEINEETEHDSSKKCLEINDKMRICSKSANFIKKNTPTQLKSPHLYKTFLSNKNLSILYNSSMRINAVALLNKKEYKNENYQKPCIEFNEKINNKFNQTQKIPIINKRSKPLFDIKGL